jgi:hypothetical protein
MRRRFRMSIAGLLAWAFAAAIAFAALRNPSVFWAQVTTSALLVGLCVATLGTCLCRGAERASWLGFAVFGGLYALVAIGPWFDETLRPLLFTTYLLDEAFLWILPPKADLFAALEGPGPLGGPARSYWNDQNYIRYQCIGHALFGLLWAAVGYAVARWFWSRTCRGRGSGDEV